MKDISEKLSTLREAVAEAVIKLSAETVKTVKEGEVPKGSVFEVARVAGVQAAKRTSELIPYCYHVALDYVNVDFDVTENEITVRVCVKAEGKAGVEMEALNAVSIAASTVYDMLRPLDDSLEITSLKLTETRGGSEEWRERFKTPIRAAVLMFSNPVFEGKKRDKAGKTIVAKLESEPVDVVEYKVFPDDFDTVKRELVRLADDEGLELILTSGGTGLMPTDVTVEATTEVIEREVPGIAEAARIYGFQRTPYAMLSRGVAGIRGSTVIINLPGSSRGADESMDALFPWVLHVFRVLRRAALEGK